MDSNAGDLGKALFDEVFEGGEDVVNAGDGKIALHDAMARDEDVVLDLADADVVAVNELVVILGHVIEKGFDRELELAHFADADFGRGDVVAERLNVDVDLKRKIAVAEVADGFFEFRGAAMGFAERKVFINLEVEFDEKAAMLLVGGDVVDGQTHALRDSTNGFEEMLIRGRPRLRVNNNIGGDDLADTLLDSVGELVNLLETGGARDGDGRVDKMPIARAAHANAFHAENSFHVANSVGDLVLQAFRSRVEKGIESAATEA